MQNEIYEEEKTYRFVNSEISQELEIEILKHTGLEKDK